MSWIFINFYRLPTYQNKTATFARVSELGRDEIRRVPTPHLPRVGGRRRRHRHLQQHNLAARRQDRLHGASVRRVGWPASQHRRVAQPERAQMGTRVVVGEYRHIPRLHGSRHHMERSGLRLLPETEILNASAIELPR